MASDRWICNDSNDILDGITLGLCVKVALAVPRYTAWTVADHTVVKGRSAKEKYKMAKYVDFSHERVPRRSSNARGGRHM